MTADTKRCATILREGGIVAFATETVFGLGANAFCAAAIERLFAAKGRPSNNPLIVHVPDLASVNLAAEHITEPARTLLEAFAPGPITVVLPKQQRVVAAVSAGLATVGIRIPSAPQALELLRECGVPVAAPSANISGRPSATTWQAALEDLQGKVDAVLQGPPCEIGLESTVVDCCGSVPVILRPGAISLDQIRALLPEAQQLAMPQSANSTREPTSIASIASPGLLHPHYRPRAKIILCDRPEEIREDIPENVSLAYCGISDASRFDDWTRYRQFLSNEEYAAGFYEFLRASDRAAVEIIVVERAHGDGIAAALRDRQDRAAGLK